MKGPFLCVFSQSKYEEICGLKNIYFKIISQNEDGEEENGYFADPAKALFKTIIMSLTGEIEFEVGKRVDGLMAGWMDWWMNE